MLLVAPYEHDVVNNNVKQDTLTVRVRVTHKDEGRAGSSAKCVSLDHRSAHQHIYTSLVQAFKGLYGSAPSATLPGLQGLLVLGFSKGQRTMIY